MKDAGNKGQRSRIVRVLTLVLIVFINCFGFPIYNLNKEWTFLITAINLSMVFCSAVMIGGFFAAAFPARGGFFVLVTTLALTLAGLGCRYLLEFGEVSNTYNFTPANLLLHIPAFAGVVFLSWLYAARQRQEGHH